MNYDESNILREMRKDIAEIKDLLNGRDGKLGIIGKVLNHDDWIRNKDRSMSGLISFVYRFVIAAILTYIAYKVGLTPPS